MYPITVLCFFIYYTIWELFSYMNEKPFRMVNVEVVDRWVKDPQNSQEDLKSIIEYSSLDLVDFNIRERMKEIRSNYIPYVDRRLIFLSVIVSAAPLLGLLGTVSGMLATFSSLSSQVGRSIEYIASGISEALITTQTGLLIALPAYALLFLIYRRRNEWVTFFTLIECAVLKKKNRISE